MLIPLGTDRPLARPTLVTYILLGLNIGIVLGQLILKRLDEGMYERVLSLLWVHAADFHWWTLITSAFLHSDDAVWHILGNSLILWVFGPNIEDRFGRLWFLAFYLAGAAASAATHALFSDHPALGASGAICALTGAYIVLFPRTEVRCLLIFFVIGVYNLPAWAFIGLSIGWNVLAQSSGQETGVAHAAHLGGTVFGAVVSLVLLWTRLLSREPYDLFSIGRQAYRRRQFKNAGWSKDRSPPTKAGLGEGLRRGVEQTDAIAAARAEVTRLLAAGDNPGAAAAYRVLADSHGDTPAATTLPRRQQYDLANHLFQMQDHQAAAYAYERLLEGYPKDAEAAKIRLLLGLINSRHLNDPVRAKVLIKEALAEPSRLDPGDVAVAQRELGDLG